MAGLRAILLVAAAAAGAARGYQVIHDDGLCTCESVEVVSSSADVAKKHGALLGSYRRRPDRVNSRPAYEHFSGDYFLFYNQHSQGFWAVSERLNTDVVRLENQGDALCPYRMRSTWRFADGNLAALVYDLSLKVVCLDDPCSMAHCGHQAACVQDEQPASGGDGPPSAAGDAASATNVTRCECNPGFYGDPYDRCYPADEDEAGCSRCRRLIFSSQNSVALSKHRNSYGEYFLYGSYEGSPVYQHFAGVEFLYKRDGNWLISDEVGLREAGLQNQGDVSECPYRFRTTWEYADIEQPGWQWVYDYTARLVCPSDPCSLTKCGFHATCAEDRGQGVCRCDEGYTGNSYIRCHPVEEPEGCDCRQLTLSSLGASALAQADKMGEYFHYAEYNGRPAYQHRSGLDYLYYAEGNAWVIGARFGGSRVGVVNFDRGECPYRLEGAWKHSVGGKLQVDASLTVVCNDFGYGAGPVGGGNVTAVADAVADAPSKPVPVYVPPPATTSPAAPPTTTAGSLPTATSPPPSSSAPDSEISSNVQTPTPTLIPTTTTAPTASTPAGSSSATTTIPPPSSTPLTTVATTTTTAGNDTTAPPPATTEKVMAVTPVTVLPIEANATEAGANSTAADVVEEDYEEYDDEEEEPKINLPCPCPEIFVNSTHPPTIEKHGAQLGRYELYDLRSDRPVYKHVEREQYLYYHPYSGGNWLINYEVGLLYGGIQNSKDLPVCPYLVNTVWQYGDSELGGWVYDTSLTVTCPTDKCSVLKCGFRAQCVHDDQGNAQCLCRKGFEGDPHVRCLPKEVDPACPCRRLHFGSAGLAREHQRDKMGDYHLWGYYNGRPVYQHFSGLDFLYFHKNSVWGVGPKIGGNSAGLLNFGTLACPHALRTPWEFGTKDKVMRRQIDSSLRVRCLDDVLPQQRRQQQQQYQQQQHLPPLHQQVQHRRQHLAPPHYQQAQQVVRSRNSSLQAPQLQQVQERGSIPQCGVRTILPDPDSLLDPKADKRAARGSFPWQARIAIRVQEGDLRHLCSGALVSDRFVVTAASCLTSHPMFRYRVVAADHSLGSEDARESTHAVQSIYVHDLYDEAAGRHDVALAKVRRSEAAGRYFEVGQFAMPACLPEPGSDYRKDVLCEVSSWDPTDPSGTLSAAAVAVVRGARCADAAADPEDGGGGTPTVCAGGLSSLFECNLDKGTPLVCPTRGGAATLVGVLAAPPDCSGGAGRRATNRFVRVSDYVRWIEERLQL